MKSFEISSGLKGAVLAVGLVLGCSLAYAQGVQTGPAVKVMAAGRKISRQLQRH
jgi:F0F1-type ATP synthase membrane subunit c/vacuolar-type H+-ATPase subunit K